MESLSTSSVLGCLRARRHPTGGRLAANSGTAEPIREFALASSRWRRWRRGWSIAAALATAAVMAGISVRVWMGIPPSGNATLDATLLLVLLTPTATTFGVAWVGARFARDVIEKWLPAMDQPWQPWQPWHAG